MEKKYEGYTKEDFINEFGLYEYLESHDRVNIAEYLYTPMFIDNESERLQEIAEQIEQLENTRRRILKELPISWKDEARVEYFEKIRKPFQTLITQLQSEMEDYCQIDEDSYQEDVSFQTEYDNWERQEYIEEQQTRY